MFALQLKMDLSLSPHLGVIHVESFLGSSSSELGPGQVQTSPPKGATRFDGLPLIVPPFRPYTSQSGAVAKGTFLWNVFPPDRRGTFSLH